MKALKRETTIAKRLPEASSEPSSAEMTGCGGSSIFNFIFFVVTASLRGGFAFDVQ
jgi:hypothetical protein